MEVIKQFSASFYSHAHGDSQKKHQRNNSNKLTFAGNRHLITTSSKVSNIRIRKVQTNTSIISRKVIRPAQNKEILANVSPIKGRKENFLVDDEEDIQKLVKLF